MCYHISEITYLILGGNMFNENIEEISKDTKGLFEQFFADNPNCSKFKDNGDAQAVFYLLSKKSNILKMMEVSSFGKPALSGCVEVIEKYYDSLPKPQIDLNDHFTRQAIGGMVRTILSKYGYTKTVQKDMPRSSKAKYFTSAMCYERLGCEDELNFLKLGDTMAVSRGREVYENWHLQYNIVFTVPGDWYDTTTVKINNKEFDFAVKYPFRSQGNAHLIFWSEGCLWFAMSFDGHKGDMFVSRNSIIGHLISTLNRREELKDSGKYLPTPSIDEIYGILKTYEQMGKDA